MKRIAVLVALLGGTAHAELMKDSNGNIVSVPEDQVDHARATGAVSVTPQEAGAVTGRRTDNSDGNLWTQVALGAAICALGAYIFSTRRKRGEVGRL